MAYGGQVLENPVTGERIVFRRTSADTGGEYAEMDLVLAPGGAVPVHVHPKQRQRFEVVAGTMRFRLGLRNVVAGPGDVLLVPAGAVHGLANGGDEPAQVRVTATPALDLEQVIETTVALAEEGRVNSRGIPRLLDLALLLDRFEAETRAPFPPHAVVTAALAPLRWIARRRGLASRYASGRRLAF